MELLSGVAELADRADKDGSAHRVFFAGRSVKSGIIPASELIVLLVKPGGKRREYVRFTKDWPGKFEPAGRITKQPRFLCSAIAGVLDGILYVGTDEVKWTPAIPGKERKPVPLNTEGSAFGCTRHDLHERDIRKPGALNPIRMVRHRLLVMLAKLAYNPKICGDMLEVQDQLDVPVFLASVNPPYQKFKLRADAPDAVDRARKVLKAFAQDKGVSDETGASMLLQVLRRADEGLWLDEQYGHEVAPFTGMYRLDGKTGAVVGYPEAPAGHEGESEDVEGTKCLPKFTEFPDFSEVVNEALDRYFEGNHHVKFEPAIGKEWSAVRQGQPIWLPRATPKQSWTPAGIADHPRYKDLCALAALATLEVHGRLAYADFDLVVGSGAWVNLDTAPRVQLVADAAGLCHYGNGIHCDLSRLDIEAHIRSIRALRKRP